MQEMISYLIMVQLITWRVICFSISLIRCLSFLGKKLQSYDLHNYDIIMTNTANSAAIQYEFMQLAEISCDLNCHRYMDVPKIIPMIWFISIRLYKSKYWAKMFMQDAGLFLGGGVYLSILAVWLP